MIRPGEIWRDCCGAPIRARAGSVIRVEGTWWWFGIHEGDGVLAHGVRAYASIDLIHWRDHGLVISAGEVYGGTIDSPKVLRCPHTGGLILWFLMVEVGTVGVAFASLPGKPFVFLHALRGGGITRDMTLFADDDGFAWHLFNRAGENGWKLARLDDTFLHHAGDAEHLEAGGFRHAPSIFKWDVNYWLLATDTSGGCAGEPCLYVAPSLHGPWESAGNPCIGSEAQVGSCFNARPSCLVAGPTGGIFMVADGTPWVSEIGRHVWLPLDFRHGVPELRWRGAWSPARLDGGGVELPGWA
jgi:hypothetical protein